MTDPGDTLDERRVQCVACRGSGLPPPSDFANGLRCPWCDGRQWTSMADAILWLRAMTEGDASPDEVMCPACRGTGQAEAVDPTKAGPFVGALPCVPCAGARRVSTARAISILDRMTTPPDSA